MGLGHLCSVQPVGEWEERFVPNFKARREFVDTAMEEVRFVLLRVFVEDHGDSTRRD